MTWQLRDIASGVQGAILRCTGYDQHLIHSRTTGLYGHGLQFAAAIHCGRYRSSPGSAERAFTCSTAGDCCATSVSTGPAPSAALGASPALQHLLHLTPALSGTQLWRQWTTRGLGSAALLWPHTGPASGQDRIQADAHSTSGRAAEHTLGCTDTGLKTSDWWDTACFSADQSPNCPP